jgi:hypothetical protein
MKVLQIFLAATLGAGLMMAQQTAPALNAPAVFAHAKAATVVILVGEGAGRLHGIATGVIVSPDGVLLTALHTIKNAAEVQVRLATGEIFDSVQLLGSDERRDVAALKISAGSLPFLTAGDSARLSQGDPVYAMTNSDGLTWSATEGIFSAMRSADELPGAGSGFRILQFTAPVAPGSSGGPLMDRSGALVGIITRGMPSAAFAVPIESVVGLPASEHHVALGSGASLQLPSKLAADLPQSGAAIANANPKQILRNAKTIHIQSRTMFLTVDTLDRALTLQKDWPKLSISIVQDPRVADVLITIDRPLFTYVHTFVLIDKRTSVVLTSGKVTAFDGTIASDGIAKQVVKAFLAAR